MSEANIQATPVARRSEAAESAQPELSATDTIISIFFEPQRVFASLRERPRVLLAALLIMAATFGFNLLFIERVGYDNIVRAKLEAVQGMADINEKEREHIIRVQSKPSLKILGYASSVVTNLLFLLGGGFLYLVGSMATTKPLVYRQALSVWTYSSLPPTLLIMLLNVLLLFIQPPEALDPLQAGRGGLVRANPGVLVDSVQHPVLTTALGSLDLFALYGLILAALGLRKVARISPAAAWGIVLFIWMGGVVARCLITAYTGTAMV